ncbi:hypothetical protein [Paractinoplanes brasiliensis]|uniref:Membrane protein YesL n=1 Tax=Paractinoplanes brasiliensis TaxID=52695 RepID=A0A4R6JZC0_9ACTN|nr:hypothetical protein [Actinoplanes brasiliensis]TDO42253.1 hypothetical protein C8E87_6020 [Actinoplanes brasiliensis]GID29481.1 hypothetical protein Abr02nite_44640 [Actinoplanes brasiliensis]
MPHDWRDSLRPAADLALLGILVTLACLPVLTAGAAVGTGSAAVHKLLTFGRWPTAAECWTSFRTRLLPGWWAGPVVLVLAWLLAVDAAAVNREAVPGGRPLVVALLVLASAGAGFLAMVAGMSGFSNPDPVRGSRASAEPRPLRQARALVAARPGALLATTGVVLLVALLALLLHPALVPVLAGYALFAVHAVLHRLTPRTVSSPVRGPAGPDVLNWVHADASRGVGSDPGR